MRSKLKLLLAVIFAVCAAMCIWLISACGGESSETPSGGEIYNPPYEEPPYEEPPQIEPPHEGPSNEGPSDEEGIPRSYQPIIDYTVKSATVSATMGDAISDIFINRGFKCTIELKLYKSEEAYNNNDVYLTSQTEQTADIILFNMNCVDDTFENAVREYYKDNNLLFSHLSEDEFDLERQFETEMQNLHGGEVNVSVNHITDQRALTDLVMSVLNFNIESNENSPITYFNLKINGEANAYFSPYAYYEYSEITINSVNEIDGIVLEYSDLNALGKYADQTGFNFVPASLSEGITIVRKGVYYKIRFNCNEFNNAIIPDDGIYAYSSFSLADLSINSDEVTGINDDSRAVKIYTADATSIKYYESLQCVVFSFGNIEMNCALSVIEPEQMSVSIPDMTVAEVPEKRNELLIELSYFDGNKISFTGAECDLKKITAQNTGVGEYNLYDSLARAYAGDVTLNCELGGLHASASYTLTPVFGYSTVNLNYLPDRYYELQSYSNPQGLQIYDYYILNYLGSRENKVEADESVYSMFEELCSDRISSGIGEKSVSLARDGMFAPEKCSVYEFTVLEDEVSSFTVTISDKFSGIIIGEDFSLADCYVEATLAHGQHKQVSLTKDMLGYYSEITGAQDVEVTYKGITQNVTLQIRMVKTFAVEDGLDKYYLVGEQPEINDVLLKVTFTDNNVGYAYLPEGRIGEMNFSSVGPNSVSITYGGVGISFSYQVIEGVYITYTQSAGTITLSGFRTGTPASGTSAFVPDDIKNIVLPEQIDGLPVTATAANLFKGQSVLRSLTVPASITNVGYGLVDGCSNLQTLTVTGSIQLKYYFAQYKPVTATTSRVFPDIPSKVEVVISGESLCDNFFADLYSYDSGKYVAKLAFGENIRSLGTQPVTEMLSVKALTDSGNDSIYIKDDVIYTDGGATLAYYCAYKSDAKFTIPDGVTHASMTSNYLQELTIPATVRTLGEEFMNNAEELTTVKFAAGSLITELPDSSFGNCTKLVIFNFPENLQRIGSYVMRSVAVEKIIIPRTVTYVGSQAFNMAKCTHFYLPTSATQSFITNNTSMYTMTSLQHVAYDGTVSISKLAVFMDTYTRQSVKLYITGEQTSVGDNWYWNYATSKITTVYVCKEAADFSAYTFSSVVLEKNGGAVDKWWL